MTVLKLLPLALLAVLVAPGIAANPAVDCDYVESADYVAFGLKVHYASHRCHYHDLEADITDRLERYDGFRSDPLDYDPQGQASDFALYTHSVETQYRNGKNTYVHRTYAAWEDGHAWHDYMETRNAGSTTCRGAADLEVPTHHLGRASIPTTPPYPTCLPRGLLP